MIQLTASAFALLAGPLSAQEVILSQYVYDGFVCLYEDRTYGAGAILILEDGTRLICKLVRDPMIGDAYTWVPQEALPNGRPSN